MSKIRIQQSSSSGMTLAHPGLALTILFALFAFFLILTPVLSGFISEFCKKQAAAVRLSMILQDVLIFILPALGTSILVTRLPAKLLALDKFPTLKSILLAVAILLSSIPVMNIIVEWNQSIHFPPGLSEFETTCRQLEESAQAVIDNLMTGASIGALLVSILIIGVMAGFSEELFFRGAMQRIFMSTHMNCHVAVWSVAVIFSLFHFQFFGFIPRMLLGAYFGYLVWWSGSLWLPIMIHILNNTLVVIFTWRTCNIQNETLDVERIGTDLSSCGSWIMAGASIIITILLFITLRKACRQPKN